MRRRARAVDALRGRKPTSPHAYGLWHVDDRGSIMYPGNTGLPWFNGIAQYHSQLLYRDVRRSEHYCGWPHGPGCALRKVQPSAQYGPPILVVD